MAKVDTELVKMVLQRNQLDVRTIAQILEDINQEQAATADESEKDPPCKKQFVAIISDPEGDLEGKEYTGWILQIPEDESVYTATEKLIRAGYEFNTTKKGRRMPVQQIGEVCEHVPASILKEQKAWVKTKEAIFFLPTDNIIPMEKTSKRKKD
ncbi:MAG: hypothetical protein LBV12_08830 [Puniceicoccales bacterium]|jgi:hypothetical protein|nr:hypothetical protein [Puniceicoccales bacterium]